VPAPSWARYQGAFVASARSSKFIARLPVERSRPRFPITQNEKRRRLRLYRQLSSLRPSSLSDPNKGWLDGLRAAKRTFSKPIRHDAGRVTPKDRPRPVWLWSRRGPASRTCAAGTHIGPIHWICLRLSLN